VWHEDGVAEDFCTYSAGQDASIQVSVGGGATPSQFHEQLKVGHEALPRATFQQLPPSFGKYAVSWLDCDPVLGCYPSLLVPLTLEGLPRRSVRPAHIREHERYSPPVPAGARGARQGHPSEGLRRAAATEAASGPSSRAPEPSALRATSPHSRAVGTELVASLVPGVNYAALKARTGQPRKSQANFQVRVPMLGGKAPSSIRACSCS
jgi:hypothetical protein